MHVFFGEYCPESENKRPEDKFSSGPERSLVFILYWISLAYFANSRSLAA